MIVAAYFTASDQPKTGLTLADIDLYLTARKKSDGSLTVIWDGSQNPTQEITGVGVYVREYSAADTSLYDYFAYANYTGAEVLDSDHVQGAVGELTAGEVWAYSTRTLTMTAAAITAGLSGSTITIQRGDTLTVSISGLGDISGRTGLWFGVKKAVRYADTKALVLIEETAGLEYINEAAASVAGNGSITVTDESNGDITITLAAVETAKLPPFNNALWDVQMLSASGVETLTDGDTDIVGDVVRAVTT